MQTVFEVRWGSPWRCRWERRADECRNWRRSGGSLRHKRLLGTEGAPTRTKKKAMFKCGQVGDMHKVNIKVGKVYVFDNHVAHEVQNRGSSLRIHLTVDLVGCRRFWNLIEGSRLLGSVRRKATMLDINVTKVEESRIAIESWRDADLQDARLHDCKGTVDALASTAQRLLPNRAAAMSCGMGVDAAVLPSGLPELVDVADSISEVHRMSEAHLELQTYGATQH